MLLLLALRRATPVRALTELALDTFASDPRRNGPLLVAGGVRESGTERVVLSALRRRGSAAIFVNIDPRSHPTVVADLSTHWPFRDRTFDLCVSTWVLEHLKDPWMFFAESHRTLRDGGMLVIAVPFIHRVHGAPSDFWRLTGAALTMLCEQTGYRRVSTQTVGGGPFLAAIAVMWPLVGVPILGSILFVCSYLLDYLLSFLIGLLGRGLSLVNSYPLAYLVYAWKEENERDQAVS